MISDDELIAFVEQYLDDQGLPAGDVTTRSELAVIGLDSISTAELLLSARAELVEAGRLAPDATLLELPPVTTVGDLADLMRTLA
jgi:acyl carrier protein